ncbi:MAG: thioredoxin family protein [Hyphomicrobiaceae bacterium]|nr:thioredoxin family protein [Hyphomicrobiaceae bacterium]
MPVTTTLLSRRLAVAVLLGATALVPAPAIARDTVQPGKPAPDFTATDSAGKPITLSALKGKTVVLEWTNHECPYVAKHYGTGTMQQLQKDATAKGIVWLTVISSAPGSQGYVQGLEADKLTTDRKAAPTAVLLDAAGKVGRLYGATTTPHMFVVDASGTIAYMGGIDDKPSTSPETIKGARPYVREALDALAAGTPVKTASTRPYGCSVKYTN